MSFDYFKGINLRYALNPKVCLYWEEMTDSQRSSERTKKVTMKSIFQKIRFCRIDFNWLQKPKSKHSGSIVSGNFFNKKKKPAE